MILISHRGNLDGPTPKEENRIEYIENALDEGHQVEVDVWWWDGFYLGHDEPEYPIDLQWLSDPRLWIHCKNLPAVKELQLTRLNYFWHDKDDYTLTSHGWIWAYPGKYMEPNTNSIAVLPEIHNTDTTNFKGICTDYIWDYIVETDFI